MLAILEVVGGLEITSDPQVMRGASGMVTIVEMMENPRWLWGPPGFWLAGILQVLGIAGS